MPIDPPAKPTVPPPVALSTSPSGAEAEVTAVSADVPPTSSGSAPLFAFVKPVVAPALPAAVSTDRSPTAVERLEPVFPPRARKRGEPGKILLNVLVGEKGKVVRVVVDQGMPGSDLEAAAIDTVLRWIYEPALQDVQPERGHWWLLHRSPKWE